MTYQNIVNILTDIAPEIADTKNPELVLLKTATKHNMYPAELEKMALAFNQMKTLVGLEKQANRGDSFSIVDPAALVDRYMLFSPKLKPVVKLASYDDAYMRLFASEKAGMLKAASENNNVATMLKAERLSILSLFDNRGAEIFEHDSEYNLSSTDGHADVTFNKLASEKLEDPIAVLKFIISNLNKAESSANTIKAASRLEIGLCADKLANMLLTKGASVWAEMVEDTVDHFGGTKCASAIEALEDYFEINHIGFKVKDMSKRAFAPVLINDRHNVWSIMEDVIKYTDMFKEASDALPLIELDRKEAREKLASLIKAAKPGPTPDGEADPKPADNSKKPSIRPANLLFSLPSVKLEAPSMAAPVTTVNTIKLVIDTVAPAKNVRLKKIDEALDDVDRDIALQRLMLGDSILQEADPYKLLDIYNTIASISPTFAKDPRMMSTALKEAVQYDAVPINMLKDIATFLKTINDNKLNVNKLNDASYKF